MKKLAFKNWAGFMKPHAATPFAVVDAFPEIFARHIGKGLTCGIMAELLGESQSNIYQKLSHRRKVINSLPALDRYKIKGDLLHLANAISDNTHGGDTRSERAQQQRQHVLETIKQDLAVELTKLNAKKMALRPTNKTNK